MNSSDICGVYTVVVSVAGNYTMTTPPWYDTTLTICRATPGSIVANPALVLSNGGSAGFVGDTSGKTSNLAFSVKYNKSGTNPQGKVRLQITSNRNASGLIDGATHTYLITTNSISSLSVTPGSNTAPSVANFAAKANVVELITDSGGTVTSVVSLDGGAILQLALTDGLTNSTPDKAGVTVNKSTGGLWFSSNWDGAKTLEKLLISGDVKVTP
jgi:hypothetical protein